MQVQLVEGVEIDILVDGSFIQSVTTDSTGERTLVIPVDAQRTQGPMLISAEFHRNKWFYRFNRRLHLVSSNRFGSNYNRIHKYQGSMIAGENITFTGTLLDEEHGQLLTDNERLISGGVIHIWIDGTDVGSIYTTVFLTPPQGSGSDL